MNRNAIIQLVELWEKKLGSQKKVAEKCGINHGALSTILAGKYGADESKMLTKIAVALGYKESNWQIVPTINNYRTIAKVVNDAKNESMWFAISNPAGSGKTKTLEHLFNQDETGSVILIQCEEWSGRQFLMQLIKKTVGEEIKGKYKTNMELIQLLSDFFNEKQFDKPVLLIDEADKLRPAAFRALIPLYNKTEDRLGVVLSGTENLEKEIKAGVRLNKKGFDEVHSRIGRNFITLKGANENDVNAICLANGITPEKYQAIWFELEKVNKMVRVRTEQGEKDAIVEFATDLRRLYRIIKREKIKNVS
ncbi:hypothetical protein BWK59_11650 [Flavobacterium davisii]|uniref:ORC1/DEAH AAA+ ATPase domain-containing protein n=1 Tax=Flavobacterium davisii TaxID=2906077 RepID=A0A246GGB9_9FLAO|nr:ATP-binding protein [Flavobacterium davisii]OWP83224.1 hypothetical protein BWK59_11650 [Flavobacterium davisii]